MVKKKPDSDDAGGTIVARTPITFKRLDNKIVVRITFDDGTEIIC